MNDLLRELRAAGIPERAAWDKRYLKSDLRHFGVPSAAQGKIASQWLRAHPELTRAELRRLSKDLFASPFYEGRAMAVQLLHERAALLDARDVPLLEQLLREAKTWALVDDLAPYVMGSLVQRDPALREVLRRWARDEDFWIRRAALLSLLLPLRRGEGDFALFRALAVPMLGEKEFFIRKAIGWILREVSKKRPQLVRGFVARHRAQMSGLTLREATKHLGA